MKRIHAMNQKQKRQLRRILIAGTLFAAALAIPAEGVLRTLSFLIPHGIVGWKVLGKAGKNLLRGQVFDENFLMCVASVGALCAGEASEAAAVMLFYQVGELFESCAVGASRRSIAELMDIRPDTARVERGGSVATVDPEAVAVGESIVVEPGERVPLDGVVIEGQSALDTAALTGESEPRSVEAGSEIISGCVNLNGVLRVRVTKPSGESTVTKILNLVENASAQKAKSESFITKFARWYTPIVCGCALLLAVVPPMFIGDWRTWISRALIFLVVSCPCALVISVPLSFFGGIGGASKRGILIKGGGYIETLSKVRTVVFDKTGTLTRGRFEVAAIHPEGISGQTLLETAAQAELHSHHPVAEAIKRAHGAATDAPVKNVREISGKGVLAEIGGREIAVGNDKLMEAVGAKWKDCDTAGSIAHVAADGEYLGHIVIADALKPNAGMAIARLKDCGVRNCVLFSGDRRGAVEAAARELNLDSFYAEMMPDEKMARVEELLQIQPNGDCLAFVGDGINDAPALRRADVGIAMGALGSDAAIEAADVVLMDDDPAKIADAMRIARRTMNIVRQNIIFALGVKALVLLLSALGYANMWAAVFADVGVSVLAILNAMRTLKCKK